ncbi:MAG: 50S ribosomal protein L29 [bacterium]|nr:50S ribosomal protein L29 [bacterium]
MKKDTFQKKTEQELQKLSEEYRTRLGQLRFEMASGKTKYIGEIQKLRKDIARVETVTNQKRA